jgi:hypothetical protein
MLPRSNTILTVTLLAVLSLGLTTFAVEAGRGGTGPYAARGLQGGLQRP